MAAMTSFHADKDEASAGAYAAESASSWSTGIVYSYRTCFCSRLY